MRINSKRPAVRAGLAGGVALALAAGAAGAQTVVGPSNDTLPDAYAAVGSGVSYFNTPNRRHTTITGRAPTTLATVTVELARESDVLVQFTSGLATVSADGCPCSVRTSLVADAQQPVVIKRVNLAPAAPGSDAGRYVPDRQPADGSFVYRLPAGRHQVALVVQQIDGTAKTLQAFYPNLQAVIFPR
jgi:hypothetical protein